MCIFCKIVNNEIPSTKVYEDDKVIAILDIAQTTEGHTLIMPKKHSDNILECDTEIAQHIMNVAQELGNKLLTNLNANGINLLANVNESAGQSVMHTHMHLIPRYDSNDSISIIFNESKPKDLDAVKKRILKDG